MNSYELTRSFFDWCFENPEKVTPNHVAVYCFSVEHCNRLGWKKNFGLPTTMVMEAVGIKSYNTYIKTFNDLVNFGFIILVEKSRNQYSANIIALSKFNKALDKALDKALIKHSTKQPQKQGESNDSIDKPINNNTNKQKNKYTIPSLDEFLDYVKSIPEFSLKFETLKFSIQSKYEQWVFDGWKDGNDKEIKNWKSKLKNTLPYLKPINNLNNGTINNETGRTRTLEDQADDMVRLVNERYSKPDEFNSGNGEHTEDINYENIE